MRLQRVAAAFALVLLSQSALAGGGPLPEPSPPESPPQRARVYDLKNTELDCTLCVGQCETVRGKSVYRFRFERKWHNYLCVKFNPNSNLSVRSYDENDAEN